MESDPSSNIIDRAQYVIGRDQYVIDHEQYAPLETQEVRQRGFFSEPFLYRI